MNAWHDLVEGVAARLAGHGAARGFLPLLTATAEAAYPATGHLPERLPVQRFWPAAGSVDPLGRLLTILDHDAPTPWRQNPNYRAHPPSAGFLDNYGYLECAGPEGPVRASCLRVGLLLLGPQTLYPLHHHPAEEIYLPLGPGRWLRDGEGWSDVAAGAVIHHPPMMSHATQSGAVALAAIYLWRGEIATAALIA